MHDLGWCGAEQQFLLEVFRRRLEYPELRREVVRLAHEHGASVVLIEDKGAGTHLIQDLQRRGELYPIACTPQGDKVTRLHAQSIKFESGQALLPERAPWLDEFLTELLAFPAGRHDDQVDAVSQALAWAESRCHGLGMVKLTGCTRPWRHEEDASDERMRLDFARIASMATGQDMAGRTWARPPRPARRRGLGRWKRRAGAAPGHRGASPCPPCPPPSA